MTTIRRRLPAASIALALGLCACTKSDPAGPEQAKAEPPIEIQASDPAAADPAKPQLPPAEEILDKAVAAIGGAEQLAKIESFYQQAEISIMGQNIGGGSQIWWKNGNFYTEQDLRGVGTVRAGKAGDEIWSEDPITGLRRLSGIEAEQLRWGSSVQLAADWRRYFDKARTIGQREEDGTTLYDVQLSAESGAQATLSFDAATGLHVGLTFEQQSPMGSSPLSVRLEDYREVDGVKIAFKQVTDAKLLKVTQTVSKIEFNVPIDESRFAMPKTDAPVVEKRDGEPVDVGEDEAAG